MSHIYLLGFIVYLFSYYFIIIHLNVVHISIYVLKTVIIKILLFLFFGGVLSSHPGT